MSRESLIVQAARAEIGTPFRWQGRESGTSLDCVGLVCAAVSAAGVELARDDRYAPRSDYSEMLRGFLEQGFEPESEPFDGAIATFWVMRAGKPRHLGIIAAGECSTWNLIETTEDLKKVVEHKLEGGKLARVDSYWRLRTK